MTLLFFHLAFLLTAVATADVPAQTSLVRVTPEKIPMDPKIAMLCRSITPLVGPHDSPTIHLYVDQQVIDYRKQHAGEFAYPIGSVFFKEKYSSGDKATLATVMTKVADNHRADDWRYEMIELPSRKPAKMEAKSCMECHEKYEKRGFISEKTEDALVKFLKK